MNTGAPWELPYQSLADPPNGPLGQQDLAEKVAAGMGRAYPCTSSTRPTHIPGLIIFESDTDKMQISDGSEWKQLAFGDDTGWVDAVDAGVTAAGATTLTGGAIKRCNGLVSMVLTMTATSGWSAGDIANFNIATLPAGYRPFISSPGLIGSGAIGPAFFAQIATNGIISVSATVTALGAGGGFSVVGTFMQ